MDLRTMLRAEEGYSRRAYPDPVTHAEPYTIGIGHTGIEVHEGLEWTDSQIEEAFEADVQRAEAQCLMQFGETFEKLSEPRKAVLVAMVFQMGMGGVLKFARMLNAIRDERWHDAMGQMLDSRWAKQTPKRAMRMARIMETGEW